MHFRKKDDKHQILINRFSSIRIYLSLTIANNSVRLGIEIKY